DAVEPAPLPQAANAVPLEPSVTPLPPSAQSPSSSPDLLSLKDQLDVLRRAGQQRQAESQSTAPVTPQPHADAEALKSFASNPIEQQLNALPNLSVAQRAYLRERPHALARPDILAWAHNFAQYHGVPVDSPTYFQVMDQALHQYGNIAFTTPPTATETQAPTPQPTPTPMPQAPQPPAPERDDDYAPHIASAPPSRSEYAGSMPPEASGRVTLSGEERSIAAATGCSEIEYAKNKLKLMQMKKAGLIKD